MTTNNADIQRLIDRFMSGQSTLGEEVRLAQYFRTHDVPEEWADYKAMFAYFDAGMPMDGQAAPSPAEGKAAVVALTPWWRKAARWATAAVVMAAVGLAALHLGNKGGGIAPSQRNGVVARQEAATEAAPVSTTAGSIATAAAEAPIIAQTAKPAARRGNRHNVATQVTDGSNSVGTVTADGIAELNEMVVAAEYDQWMSRLQSDINTEQAMALIEQGAAVAVMLNSDGSDTDGAMVVP